MSLQFYRKDDTAEFPLERYHFFVFGTAGLIRRTNDFRNYIDVDSDVLREKLFRCFDIASSARLDPRLVFWLDAPRPGGEYAILRADLDTGDWLDDLDSPSRIVVADSFDELLERSPGFMLTTESGFWYWNPREAVPSNQFW
jgi:hypothetical protein